MIYDASSSDKNLRQLKYLLSTLKCSLALFLLAQHAQFAHPCRYISSNTVQGSDLNASLVNEQTDFETAFDTVCTHEDPLAVQN